MGRLSLKVVPGSSRDEIVGWLGDSLKVKVKAPPEKGRANEAVVTLLAERLGFGTSSITVVSGHGSPRRSWPSTAWMTRRFGLRFPAKSPGKAVSREPENKRVSRYPSTQTFGCLMAGRANRAAASLDRDGGGPGP